MEQDVVKDLEICRQERDILKQKLHVHLDRWTLDKIVFDDITTKSAQELRLVLAEHAYDMSLKDLRLRSQEQELLVLRLKLESALEDTELKEVQVVALRSQLQEERKWLHYSNQKLFEMKEKVLLKVRSQSRKMREKEGRIAHLERLLEEKQKTRILELEGIRKEQISEITDLKAKVRQLESKDEEWKARQAHWGLDRTKLMGAAQERDSLRAEKEKWNLEQKEIQEAMIKRDMLTESALQEVIKERDLLTAQKQDWLKTEQNLDLLQKDKDDLKHRLEDFEREHSILQRKLELNTAQREEEVKALIRERDFVWNQMRRMEETYRDRIQKLHAQKLVKKQEYESLRSELEREKSMNNDKLVEMAIAKLEGKQAEDLAKKRETELKASLQELQSRLDILCEGRTEIDAAVQDRPFNHNDVVPSEKQGGSSCNRSDEATADARIEGPEVLNGDGHSLDQDVLVSQVDQGVGMDQNKTLDELQRENGNLRRETENLKALYADLEDAQRRKRQKPARGGNKANNRDATIRNLKGELEAAAATGRPSKKDSTSVRKSGNLTKSKSASRHVVTASKPNQIKTNAGDDMPDQADIESLNLSERFQQSQRVTRSSSRTTANIALQQTLRSEDRENELHGEDHSTDFASEPHDMEPARKKTKANDTRDVSQRERLPLAAISHNQKSSAKSKAQFSSLAKGLSKSDSKTLLGSPNQTSKMMANLFSTAFSVPKLKHVQTLPGL